MQWVVRDLTGKILSEPASASEAIKEGLNLAETRHGVNGDYFVDPVHADESLLGDEKRFWIAGPPNQQEIDMVGQSDPAGFKDQVFYEVVPADPKLRP